MLSLCDVALNPMTSGSGTNLKMIDYFSAGAPVVATSVGTRGIPAVHARDLLIADDDDTFIAAIAESVNDTDSADTRARSARQLAIDYDWQGIGARMVEAIRDLCR